MGRASRTRESRMTPRKLPPKDPRSPVEPPNITHENRGVPGGKANYYARYRWLGRPWREPTGARTLAEFAIAKKRLEQLFRTGQWTPPLERQYGTDADVFGVYAVRVVDKRIARGIDRSELGLLKNHLLPEFGAERLADLTFKRIELGFARIAAKPTIGGATVRNIYVVFRAIMRAAAKDELILAEPPPLSIRDGELPAIIERRHEGWRDEALFSIEEVAQLLAAEHIEAQYRVMYVVYFLTGSRFSEVTRLRMRDYLRTKKPLGQLTIRAAKSGRTKGARYRMPPVHPALAAWLDWWLDEGYEFTHLRAPQSGDFMFPTISVRRARKAAARELRRQHEVQCSHGEVYKRWARHHLPGCQLRHRRLHDSRRTTLSLLRSSGAPPDVARAITHTVVADKVLDAYTTFQWETLCRAMLTVEWRLPGPPHLGTPGASSEGGEVVDLAAARR